VLVVLAAGAALAAVGTLLFERRDL